jgi:molybdate transport system substrate-binding protein
MKKSVLALILSFIAAATPLSAQGLPLLVSAAASLTDVLVELKAEAEKAVGSPIQFNFGASGTLRKQISEGAPVDIFFSAAASDMESLDKAGFLLPGSRRNLLSNAIALIGNSAYPEFADAAAFRRPLADAKVLAIGNPDSVPAGRYAVEALRNLGLYPLVEGKLALGGSVREVLQFVQSGSAPLGIVFLTDAMTLKPGSGVKILYRFSSSLLAAPVLYPIAIVRATKNSGASKRFIAFLQEPAAEAAFARAGFVKP